MNTSSRYTLQPLPDRHSRAEYSRRLVLDGQPLATVLHGEEISLQLECDGCTLLATSYDYFDGVAHWIYLLREGGRPIDQLRMPDVFGFLHEVKILGQQEVEIGFYGTNDRWRLRISRSGYWSFAPAEIRMRPLRFMPAKRHLITHRTPGAPWAPQPL